MPNLNVGIDYRPTLSRLTGVGRYVAGLTGALARIDSETPSGRDWGGFLREDLQQRAGDFLVVVYLLVGLGTIGLAAAVYHLSLLLIGEP